MKEYVRCETQEQWDSVTEKLGYKWNDGTWNDCKEKSSINLNYKGYTMYKGLDETYSFQEWCDLNNYIFDGLKIMTDKELIEEANRRYPRGTKFKSAAKGSEIYISGGNAKSWKSGTFPDGIGNDDLLKEFTNGLLYANGEWAEIISLPEKLELKAYTGKFKIGDKVKVTRIAESREGDWWSSWINTMTLLVGKECIINNISSQFFGYAFINSDGTTTAYFPEFVLELVESADSLKQSEKFDRNFYVEVNSQEEADQMFDYLESIGEKTCRNYQKFSDVVYIRQWINLTDERHNEWFLSGLTNNKLKRPLSDFITKPEETLDSLYKNIPVSFSTLDSVDKSIKDYADLLRQQGYSIKETDFKKEPVKLLLFDEDDNDIVLFKNTTIKTSNKQLIINDTLILKL